MEKPSLKLWVAPFQGLGERHLRGNILPADAKCRVSCQCPLAGKWRPWDLNTLVTSWRRSPIHKRQVYLTPGTLSIQDLLTENGSTFKLLRYCYHRHRIASLFLNSLIQVKKSARVEGKFIWHHFSPLELNSLEIQKLRKLYPNFCHYRSFKPYAISTKGSRGCVDQCKLGQRSLGNTGRWEAESGSSPSAWS